MTEDYCINIDSDNAKEFGFTSDKFDEASWLWRVDNAIWLSMIITKIELRRQGHLKTLCQTILDKGFTVIIPTPLGPMIDYVKNYGYTNVTEIRGHHKIETWVKKPPEKTEEEIGHVPGEGCSTD